MDVPPEPDGVLIGVVEGKMEFHRTELPSYDHAGLRLLGRRFGYDHRIFCGRFAVIVPEVPKKAGQRLTAHGSSYRTQSSG